MGVITRTVAFKGDSDGYFTYECPFCKSAFKLKIAEMKDNEKAVVEIFCPYCGLTDTITHFYTKEVIEHVTQIAKNYAIDMINKNAGKIIKPLKKENVPVAAELDTVEQEFECIYCKHHIKALYHAGASKIFCA
jgi:DNA-directed RNA polymerase subunit RPC12/RpoP